MDQVPDYGQATIDVDGKNILGTPRKDPLIDTQVAMTGAAHPTSMTFYLDTSKFETTTSELGSSKVQGRDTNIKSRLGTLAKGEKFWIYGMRLRIDAPNVALNVNNGDKFFDEVGRLICMGWFEWDFAAGNQSFLKRPLRELQPTCNRKPVAFAVNGLAADHLLFDINGQGMFDLRINNRPYSLGSLEEMTVAYKWQTVTTILTPTFAIAYQNVLEGIRVFGQKN